MRVCVQILARPLPMSDLGQNTLTALCLSFLIRVSVRIEWTCFHRELRRRLGTSGPKCWESRGRPRLHKPRVGLLLALLCGATHTAKNRRPLSPSRATSCPSPRQAQSGHHMCSCAVPAGQASRVRFPRRPVSIARVFITRLLGGGGYGEGTLGGDQRGHPRAHPEAPRGI